MGCLTEQTIAEYVEGQLDEAGVDRVESHIDGCTDCRMALAEAARWHAASQSQPGAGSALPPPSSWPSLSPSSINGEVAPGNLLPRLAAGAQVGRYVVRRVVGAGGMGIVYAAYDAKLDREIALKLLRPELNRFAEERLDREAKLMARLAHPNVITIHDVGTLSGQAYVAMELVVGETLGQKLRSTPRKSWHEVLDLFLAAGRGLAAAHREGVVHRDFKPDNVLVGKDGRVRVTDFGLARAAHEGVPLLSEAVAERSPGSAGFADSEAGGASRLTRTGALLGTPAYMAPEQLRGREADAQSDQFGFCVALYEGLYGERPFHGATLEELAQASERGAVRGPRDRGSPAWLRRAVMRGLRAAPSERWPSMDALLDALGRDRAGSRWRWAAAGAALALGVAGAGVARLSPAERPCRGASALLAGVWDEPRRQAVQKAFAATGVPYAEDAWSGVRRALDLYAQAWSRMHKEACEATRVRGEQSAELLDLRMHCLDKQRQELSALVAIYARADSDVVQRAVGAVPAASGLRICADARELLQPVRPPEDPTARARITALEQRLAGLRAQHQAGQYQAALKEAQLAASESLALTYAPIEAEAHLLLGDIQQTLGEYAAAEASFYHALWAGEAGKQDRIAARAWTRIVYVVGYSQERVAESQRLLQHAEAALRRLGDDEIERAALESAAGSMAFQKGQYTEAEHRFETSRALLEKALGPESLELGAVLQRLALVHEPLGNWTQAIALERRSLAILEKRFGPEHPQTADSRRRLAQHLFYNEYLEEALGMAQQALATYERSDPTDDEHVASALLGVSEILLDMDRGHEALPLTARAVEIRSKRRDPWHTDVAEARAGHSAALLQVGQTDAALKEGQRVREIIARTLGTEHIKYAWALSDLGRIYAARGEHQRAYEAHRESLDAVTRSQVKDVWSIEKQRIEVGRAELALRNGAAALATLERAVETLERDDSIAILLGDAYFHLAEVLAFLKRDAPRVESLAKQALAVYGKQKVGREKRMAQVERFLAQQVPPPGRPR